MTDHKRYLCLDAVRGVAALAIVFHHIGDMIAPFSMPGAYRAVDLFFVLSGFVLAHSYGARFGRDMSARRFMALRLIRLYPLFLIGALGGIGVTAIALVLGGGQYSVTQWALSSVSLFFMLPSPTWSSLPQLTPLNTPAWSLILEILINLLYGLVAVRLTTRRLILVIGASALWLLWVIAARGDSNVGSDWATLPGGLARVTFSFGVGVLLARFKPARRRATAWAWLIPLAVGPALYFEPVPGALLDAFCIFALFPGMILLGMHFEVPQKGVAALMGDLSYPIYILHLPAAMLLYKVFVVLGHEAKQFAPVVGIGFTLALIPVCIGLERLYDRPVRRWLSARLLPPARPSEPHQSPPALSVDNQ